jgi:hypothetical protein
MKAIDSRLNKLENRFGLARNAARYLLILMDAGRELGPADDAYIKSLDEAGFLPTGGFGIVKLNQIPLGLSDKEAERFVRENGANICGRPGAQNPGGPKSEGDQKRSAQSVVIELEDRSVSRS